MVFEFRKSGEIVADIKPDILNYMPTVMQMILRPEGLAVIV